MRANATIDRRGRGPTPSGVRQDELIRSRPFRILAALARQDSFVSSGDLYADLGVVHVERHDRDCWHQEVSRLKRRGWIEGERWEHRWFCASDNGWWYQITAAGLAALRAIRTMPLPVIGDREMKAHDNRMAGRKPRQRHRPSRARADGAEVGP